MLRTSGTAETTTLRMMAGLEMPTSGQICIDGEEVGRLPAGRRDIAFVFQMFALYPHMNVRKNISYPLISQGMSREAARAKVAKVSRILGIEDILERPVGGLSGGDRQRVALGRTILREPKAFFMDEPLGALDAEFREHMAEEPRALHDRMGETTVYVTHDQIEAMTMASHVGVLDQGRLVQFGSPREIYEEPVSVYVASRLGQPRINILPANLFVGAPKAALHRVAPRADPAGRRRREPGHPSRTPWRQDPPAPELPRPRPDLGDRRAHRAALGGHGAHHSRSPVLFQRLRRPRPLRRPQ
ncbi:ABC transporter ATP-binding protein [Salipiger thiooxidans]